MGHVQVWNHTLFQHLETHVLVDRNVFLFCRFQEARYALLVSSFEHCSHQLAAKFLSLQLGVNSQLSQLNVPIRYKFLVAIVYIKVVPLIARWFHGRNQLRAEREMRRRAVSRASKERYYEEEVDPILKKISEHGIDSLTREEREILERVSKVRRDRGKILPFDLSR